jgi:hypothetical protein
MQSERHHAQLVDILKVVIGKSYFQALKIAIFSKYRGEVVPLG